MDIKQTRQLTEKQQAFCRYMFTEGSETFGNGTESARKAGYKGKDNMLATIAKENIRKQQIIEQKEAIQAKTVEKLDHDRDKAIELLHLAVDMAKDQKNPNALTSAVRELNAISMLHSSTVFDGKDDVKSIPDNILDLFQEFAIERTKPNIKIKTG